MLHPIYTTVLRHPELVADHLANYMALVREEAGEATRQMVARIIAGVLAAISAIMALGLIGIAVMMGVLHGSFHWVLVAVPGVAVLVAAVAGYYASRPSHFDGFEDIRAQLDADVRALHLAGDQHAR
ncbi:phage holin family protein [Variovorax sp. OV329]|uniref:phage holin family protein n=1 Tax=Variovorax sp. OV329 TaxID=1882825 RepID=UPI0008DF651D|nr:phage holin family protein [Variovorax sp. OV329]SFM06865.1 Putative Holin-X, holin superfamily III [Variovorax sp. OV329]